MLDRENIQAECTKSQSLEKSPIKILHYDYEEKKNNAKKTTPYSFS